MTQNYQERLFPWVVFTLNNHKWNKVASFRKRTDADAYAKILRQELTVRVVFNELSCISS